MKCKCNSTWDYSFGLEQRTNGVLAKVKTPFICRDVLNLLGVGHPYRIEISRKKPKKKKKWVRLDLRLVNVEDGDVEVEWRCREKKTGWREDFDGDTESWILENLMTKPIRGCYELLHKQKIWVRFHV